MSIYDEIQAERAYQNEKWGTEFDDKNTLNDWAAYIVNYLGKAVTMGLGRDSQRRFMLKVAALAVAAIESFDRNGKFADRHYD